MAASISDGVKRPRVLPGWIQEEFAREIGGNLPTVQRWEAKGGNPIPVFIKTLNLRCQEPGVKFDV